jgi:hypothetical protein
MSVTAMSEALALPTTKYDDGSFSEIFERISISFGGAPGLLSAAAYLMGIILAFGGILKVKEHVEDPKTSLREAMIRFVIGGCMFALPTIMTVATNTIGTQTSGLEIATVADGTFAAGYVGGGDCDLNAGAAAFLGGNIWSGLTGGSSTIGHAICYVSDSFKGLPGLLTLILYVAGIVLVIWGLLAIKDYVIAPDRAPLSPGLKRLLVAGAFFAFPSVAETAYTTFRGGDALIGVDPFALMASTGGGACVGGATGAIAGIVSTITNLFSTGNLQLPGSNVGGLDCMMIRMVSDVWGPVQMAVSIFCYIAGLILIAAAIRRMMDGMDKGPKGPLGQGTLGMLAVGGMLLAIDTIISTVTSSMFPDALGALGVGNLKLFGGLSYAPGLSASGVASINSIITTVFAFSFLVGIISIVRGLFILKEVANGGQASLMAAFSHIIGGGAAVNLGPFIGAIQNTLGLSSVGIQVGLTPFF